MKKLLFILVIILCNKAYSQEDNSYDIQAKKFETLLKIVERTYVENVDKEEMVENAIRGLLKELDPHSVYISKDDLKKANEPLVGNFEGVGIQFNILNDTITVVSPISGGPSEKVGILSGDKIVEIEEENVAGTGITNKGVIDRLRGKKGTQVKVGIVRRGEKELLDFTITRDKIPLFSVDASYMATPEIGYIKVNRFAATTMKEFHKALDTLHAQGIKHLILDLRGNSGGYLNTAIELADEFLGERKLIVYTEGRAYSKDEKYATSKGGFEKGKLVILIDEGSASASEIVSGAIQDWDRGLIVGRRSFGKGLVQKPFYLPDKSAVRLTVSRYHTPTGRCIQKPYNKGVEKYYKDIQNRYKHGEFANKDSIDFPDSLKYYTHSKRLVYGGGGIMPDIFVPIDTTMNSTYYRNILRKGILNDFSLTYLDNNRKKLDREYATFKSFKNDFIVDEKLLSKLTNYADKKGVKKNVQDFKKSKKIIAARLKALIARGIWKTGAYFEIINEVSPAYEKAVEAIQDDTFEKMQLGNN